MPVAGIFSIQRLTAARARPLDNRKGRHDKNPMLPDGYDTVVGDRGHRLSGGERQRLAMARVLLKDPKIIILDEATSALDSRTEAAVQRSFEALMRGRMNIVIAHRLSTIRDADMIYVVHEGEIVESGTHDELMRLEGHYSALCMSGDDIVRERLEVRA
jgi:ATP-binding cassette subfamily B protein